MDLNTLWFILITVLFAGFFVLEGFDFGVGILSPFVGKTDDERRMALNAIGPFWDGNEVWLITAGGALFAAFPNWYATLFSTFYIPFVLLLMALILRGVGIEFRGKEKSPRWRATWDWIICASCALAAILVGVAFTNFALGFPVNEKMHFTGSLFDLLSGKALLGGLVSLGLCVSHGALFLLLRTSGDVRARAHRLARSLHMTLFILLALLLGTLRGSQDIPFSSQALRAGMLLALFGSFLTLRKKREGWAFGLSALVMVLFPVIIFESMFPNVVISTLNPDWNLNIHTASSSPYTLTIMSVVALVFVPIVLVYQGWTYWVFRKRLTGGAGLKY